MSEPTSAPAGWYPIEDGRKLYWDGSAWTEYYDDPKAKKPKARLPMLAVWAFVVVALTIGFLMGSLARGSSGVSPAEVRSLEREIETLEDENAALLERNRELQAAGQPPVEEDYAAIVVERWGDCLADLGITDPPAYAATGDDGTQVVGYVVAQKPGLILTFTIGISNTGAVITIPSDSQSLDALETVGC
jgi:hypothetical protein